MQLKPEQISRIIRSQIKYYENAIEQTETGTVTMVGDGIARAAGLDNCMAGELVQFESGTYGMAQNLEENSVSIVLLGDDEGIKEGSTIKRTGKVVSVPVGEGMIGRVVNALGQPIDGKGPIEAADYRAIESPAPGILDRQPVKQPLQTGIKAIDSMIPIGRGQRELIMVTARPARPSLPPIPSSTRRARTFCASMLPSVRSALPWQRWSRISRKMALWRTQPSSVPPRPSCRLCSISPPTQAAPWVNTS